MFRDGTGEFFQKEGIAFGFPTIICFTWSGNVSL